MIAVGCDIAMCYHMPFPGRRKRLVLSYGFANEDRFSLKCASGSAVPRARRNPNWQDKRLLDS